MIRHHLILSCRTLWRNKFHSAINITGLAIGVSACLIIYLIVSFELSFNKDIKDHDRIYRVHSKFNGVYAGVNRGAPTAVAPYIREHLSNVESVTHFHSYGSKVVVSTGQENKKFETQDFVALIDPQFFTVFDSYTWVIGSPDVLTKPYQTVLVESQLKKYFGDVDPSSVIGKEVIYHDSLVTHVAGVVRDLPFHTDLKLTDFISFATIEASWLKENFRPNDWQSTNSGSQVFVKVAPGITQKMLQARLPELAKEYANHAKNKEWSNEFGVQPLSDLHYNAELGVFDFEDHAAHLPTLITLIFVALLLLIIGAINFINLETAQAIRRAKEVGIRKVLGSTRERLILQFLTEGLILTLIAIVLAIPLGEFGLNYFSEFVPQGVKLNIVEFIPFLLFVIFFIGILASFYPAFVLSSFLPALALKSKHATGSSGSGFLRKVLIVFQFSFAQVLIIGTVIVGWQIRYMLNKDLGFKKDAVIYFSSPWWEKSEKTAALRNELNGFADVKELSMSDTPPSANGWSSNTLKYNNGKEDVNLNAYRKFGDVNYLNFYNIQLLEGRNLIESDTMRELIINETLARQLGFQNNKDAIGETVEMNNKKIPIVAVVKDFHTRSLHNKVDPVVIANEMKNFTCFNLRLATADKDGEALKATLDKIEAAWKKIYPDSPFRHRFLDETIKNFYQTEQRIAKLTRTATGLAILISCLGLFGLASFATAQRTKEVGIRKVLGASVQQIVLLLSKDFLLLVLMAFVIATPVAWYAADKWLQGFSYHTEITLWMFAITGLLAMAIAFVTISFKTVKAANSNPVDSLRAE